MGRSDSGGDVPGSVARNTLGASLGFSIQSHISQVRAGSRAVAPPPSGKEAPMATKLGSDGLLEADLVIPQGTTFACAVEHVSADGSPVDHDGCEAFLRVIDKAKATHDLGGHVTFDGGDILVELPPEATRALALGNGRYDLMLRNPTGEVVRVLYGAVSVVDTYAMDDA